MTSFKHELGGDIGMRIAIGFGPSESLMNNNSRLSRYININGKAKLMLSYVPYSFHYSPQSERLEVTHTQEFSEGPSGRQASRLRKQKSHGVSTGSETLTNNSRTGGKAHKYLDSGRA